MCVGSNCGKENRHRQECEPEPVVIRGDRPGEVGGRREEIVADEGQQRRLGVGAGLGVGHLRLVGGDVAEPAGGEVGVR